MNKRHIWLLTYESLSNSILLSLFIIMMTAIENQFPKGGEESD